VPLLDGPSPKSRTKYFLKHPHSIDIYKSERQQASGLQVPHTNDDPSWILPMPGNPVRAHRRCISKSPVSLHGMQKGHWFGFHGQQLVPEGRESSRLHADNAHTHFKLHELKLVCFSHTATPSDFRPRQFAILQIPLDRIGCHTRSVLLQHMWITSVRDELQEHRYDHRDDRDDGYGRAAAGLETRDGIPLSAEAGLG